MAKGNINKNEAQNNDVFIISRVFDAPRKLVFDYWTKPELMAKWAGPKETKIGKYTMDFRVGGSYHYCMVTAEGNEMWGKSVYREITPPEKLVYVNSFADEKGNVIHHPMSPTWPLEMLSVITFEELNGKTKVTINWTALNANDEERNTFATNHSSMNQGWGGSLDRLEESLAKAK